MTVNIVNKASAPVAPYSYEIIDLQTDTVPFSQFGFWLKSQKYFWASASDWTVGRSLLAERGARELMGTSQDLINSVDRLYNMLDASINGLERTVVGTGTELDPFVYTPTIPQVYALADAEETSLRWYGADQYDFNATIGIGQAAGRFPDNRNFRDLLQVIADNLDATGPEIDDLEELLQLILLALA